MARVCHTNNCPVGVASQREELRARFPGTPGDLVNYFQFVAEEVTRHFRLPPWGMLAELCMGHMLCAPTVISYHLEGSRSPCIEANGRSAHWHTVFLVTDNRAIYGVVLGWQVRAGLAALGLRSLDELVGRANMLKQRDMKLAKTSALDLSFVTTFAGETGKSSDRRKQCVPLLFRVVLSAFPTQTGQSEEVLQEAGMLRKT